MVLVFVGTELFITRMYYDFIQHQIFVQVTV